MTNQYLEPYDDSDDEYVLSRDAYMADHVDFIADALSDEAAYYRDSEANWSSIDLPLAAGAAMGGAVIAQCQSELPTLSAASRAAMDKTGWLDMPEYHLASLPISWQGIVLAAGAFALVNSASRIRSAVRFPEEAARAIDQVNAAQELIPASRKETFVRRMTTKTVRGAVTALACFGAYKTGEHLSISQDLIGAEALVGLGYVSIGVSHLRAGLAARRRSNASEQAFRQLSEE